VLFTGDAEDLEEVALNIGGPVSLLQVGHRGSRTSSTLALLAQAWPTYAVISSGLPDEGTNHGYCHPNAATIAALAPYLFGNTTRIIRAFAGASCAGSSSANWMDIAASDRLWHTARDGDVVLVTTGDGRFVRE
jgi:hypothetical protein